MKIDKDTANALLILRSMANNNTYIIQKWHTFLHSLKVTLAISLKSNFSSLIYSLHPSTNLSTNLFLHLQHCTKNLISQGLEYHERLRKTNEISSFHQCFRWKEDCISNGRKVQNNNFWLTSKYHLSMNFLTQKKAVSHINKRFKTRTFQ